MLIFSLAVAISGVWYIVTRAETSEVTARWIERWAEVSIRALRAHAAGQRAARAAYRTEWERRWNVYHAHEQGDQFWSDVAHQLGGEA